MTLEKKVEGAPMDGELFNVSHVQPVPAEQRLQRDQREVAQVLVVNGVELELLQHGLDVGDLDYRDSSEFEHCSDARNEAVQIADVSEHVVGMYDVRELAVCAELAGHLLSEEFRDGRDATLACSLGDIRRGLDPEHRNPGLAIELQKISVVAGQLDDKAARSQAPQIDEPPSDLLCMAQHGVGER